MVDHVAKAWRILAPLGPEYLAEALNPRFVACLKALMEQSDEEDIDARIELFQREVRRRLTLH